MRVNVFTSRVCCDNAFEFQRAIFMVSEMPDLDLAGGYAEDLLLHDLPQLSCFSYHRMEFH